MIAVLGALLAACTSTPDFQTVALPRPAPAQLETPTQRENQRIVGSYGGVYNDPKLEAMVSETVDRLVRASEKPDLKYKVIILNSSAINAFALPNGQLYVTRGLIALADDRAELAAVLAHEMGHVIARHAQIREQQARQTAMLAAVANDVLKDPEVGALALAKSKLTLASFSRAQEFEADALGIGISSRAGFDPYGAVRFLSDMQRFAELKTPGGEADPRATDFLATHPATPERVQNAQANARQYGTPGTGERDRADFLGAIDGMVYGEDPSEGFVRGRRFLHPKLGFTFLAPPGFSLDNTAQAVLGVNDAGDEAMRFDVVQVPARQTLRDYLSSGWMENVDVKSIKNFNVNGFPAAVAHAAGKEWSYRLYAVRFGSDVYRFIFAAKKPSRATDQAFRESLNSFRRMTLQEAKNTKPLRIKIVTVGPTDTINTLAARMDVGDKKRERFLVLNGLQPGETLTPGSQVKIIVE
ncbi:MAG: putative Zn-dependent protease [Pseudolabrys sp.]|jgi:predicted Zn-dependent protease|nr:putative Zn-dependent protease [Pseudolabrys sp.]